MLAGNGASLTAIQRAEGNAEAVLEATGVTSSRRAQQQKIREDVQRQLDAEAGAMPVPRRSSGFAAADASRCLSGDGAHAAKQ